MLCFLVINKYGKNIHTQPLESIPYRFQLSPSPPSMNAHPINRHKRHVPPVARTRMYPHYWTAMNRTIGRISPAFTTNARFNPAAHYQANAVESNRPPTQQQKIHRQNTRPGASSLVQHKCTFARVPGAL